MIDWVLNLFAEWEALLAGVVIGLVCGLALHRIATRLIVWCATCERLAVLAGGLRRVGCPACWLHYSVQTNAVIERHIRNCVSARPITS